MTTPTPRRRLTRSALLLAGCAAMAQGQAQTVYRCPSAAGPVSFQQAPCSDGERLQIRTLNVVASLRPSRPAGEAIALAPAVDLSPSHRRADVRATLQRLPEGDDDGRHALRAAFGRW